VSEEHPSYYALDRLRAGLPGTEPVRAHVSSCASCAAHLQAVAPAAPPWLAGVTLRPRRRRVLLWSATATATAALGLVVAVGRPDQESAIREKGSPSVEVFIRRGEEVFAWDGHRPVRPRDRLRLRLRGNGYDFVSVASLPDGDAAPAVLYEGSLAPGPVLLPLSFQVDDQGSAERLSVILGRRPMPAQLHAGRARVPEDGWRQIIALDKERPEAGGAP
jgi:hypothetical protein